ncbi:MAG: lecithin retinol acyltransferase family protein [Turicibacter sp.]|nr:lecithin retinol acyltransferase family protein [Turicibacter sp.]
MNKGPWMPDGRPESHFDCPSCSNPQNSPQSNNNLPKKGMGNHPKTNLRMNQGRTGHGNGFSLGIKPGQGNGNHVAKKRHQGNNQPVSGSRPPHAPNQKSSQNQMRPGNNQPKNTVPRQQSPAPPRSDASKQAFTPLERIGITISNKLGTAFAQNKSRYHAKPADINSLDCGDHVCVERYQPMAYTHHGLYLGFGMIIHYDFQEIRVVTIDEFSKGRKIYKVNSPISYSPEMVLARAATRIGERRYNLMTNNCEHFVRWCRNGQEIPMMPKEKND